MEVFTLSVQGTVVIINGGLLLLGIAFAVKYTFKKFISKKTDK